MCIASASVAPSFPNIGGRSIPDSVIEPVLARFIQDRMIESHIPGLSVALVRGKQVTQRHFGFRELRHRTLSTGSTRYGLGSVTKVFTAIAVLQLVQEGRVALDDLLSKHLRTEAAAFAGVTVKQALAHSGGLPALGWSETKMSSGWFMDGFPVATPADIQTFLDGAEDWRNAAPGERWQYSNEGYLLLGRLLEVIDERPYAESIRTRLLEPMQMSRSTFDSTDVESDVDRVQPYMYSSENGLIPGANLYGPQPAAGGLVSTTDDMVQFVRMLLAKGKTDKGHQLLRSDLISAMATPEVRIDQPTMFGSLPLWSDGPRYNGAGLQVQTNFFDQTTWGHGGGVMGGTTYFAVMPEAQIGVILLANAHGYPLAQLALVVLASMLGHTPDSLPFVRRQQLMKRIAGRYASWAGAMQAEVIELGWGLRLRMEFEPSAREIPLVLYDHDAAADRVRLIAFGSGPPALVEVSLSATAQELRYERYAFRKV